MTDYANFALIIAGLVPIIFSATKVEKYYTEYYIGLWNIYGSTLIILGFILDEQISVELKIIGIFFIIFFWVMYWFAKVKSNPDIIRSLGWSSIQFSIDLFFIVAFLTTNLLISFFFALYSFLMLFLTRQIKTTPKRYSYNRYRSRNRFSKTYSLSSTRTHINPKKIYIIIMFILLFGVIILVVISIIEFWVNFQSMIIPVICIGLESIFVFNEIKNEY